MAFIDCSKKWGEVLTSFFCVVVIILKRLKEDKENFFLICSKVDAGPMAPPLLLLVAVFLTLSLDRVS